jgi:anti-anti-sigma regulatory factor
MTTRAPASRAGRVRRKKGTGSITAYPTKAGRRWRYEIDVPLDPRRPEHGTRTVSRAGFPSPDAAEDGLTLLKADILRGVPPVIGRDTFAAYAARWLAGRPVGNGTRIYIQRVLDALDPYLGSVPVADIRPPISPRRTAVWRTAPGRPRRASEPGRAWPPRPWRGPELGPGGVWVDHDRVPDAPLEPDVVVLRVESGLFFANADYVRDTVIALLTKETVAVVLDAETIPTIDVTGVGMLVALRERLAARGIQLLVAKSIGQVRDVVATAEPAADVAGRHDTIDGAVTAARSAAASAPRAKADDDDSSTSTPDLGGVE